VPHYDASEKTPNKRAKHENAQAMAKEDLFPPSVYEVRQALVKPLAGVDKINFVPI
jgi:hypothetical protein